MRSRFLAALLLTACGSSSGGTSVDAGKAWDGPGEDAGPVLDGVALADAAACTCGTACCAAGEACAYGVCVPQAPCAGGDDCQDDAHCDDALGLCLPFDLIPGLTYDPGCTNLVTVGVFAPSLQCEWTRPPDGDPYPNHRNVMATPLVADFKLDGDPATLHPSIVVVTTDYSGGGSCFDGVLRLIDGATCTQQLTIDAAAVLPSATPALGDLDGEPDGRPEIVAQRSNGTLVAFRYDAAAGAFVVYWSGGDVLTGCDWGAVSIHDLDDDGVPEVVVGDSVLDGRTGVHRASVNGTGYGSASVVADLDADGWPETVNGARYEWDPTAGAGGWVLASTMPHTGKIAVGDFGTFGADPALDDRGTLDGIAEIVVAASGLWVMTIDGRKIFSPGWATGPPTVADFDGDGRAEVGITGGSFYAVYDPDCAVAPADPATCPTLATNGVLWSSPTQDGSSITGSSVFDFEGDGRAEVLYEDECFVRVYDGRTGDIEYSRHHTSCTWSEYPIAADVDGDFNTEIVIPSNNACGISCPAIDPLFDGLRCLVDSECPGGASCGFEADGDVYGRCRCTVDADCGGAGFVCTDPALGPSPVGKVCRASHPAFAVQGIQVVRDPLDRWVNSRPVWNQYAYSVTNVNEDGSIPRTSEWVRNWTVPTLNNFRANAVGSGRIDATPDLTLRLSFACTSDPEGLGDDAGLRAHLCNRGAGPIAAGVPVTLYRGDPVVGDALCTLISTSVLHPGECETLLCDVTLPTGVTLDVVGVADDAAGGTAEASHECYEGNNRATVTVECKGGIE